MTTSVSQAKAQAQAIEKVNGSALTIVAAAIGAHKAAGKLSVQVRALMSSPVPVVEATLSAVFVQLAQKVKPEAWATIANSIATHVRTTVKALPEESRPAVCYIALNRAECTASVVVMKSATEAQLKARLGHDQKAYNAQHAALFGKAQPAALHTPSEAPKLVTPSDKHAPKGGVIGAIMEQTRGLAVADLQKLVAQLSAEIAQREEKRLAAEQAKGKVTAAGKPNAKARGESQRVAKNQPSKPSKAAAAPTAPTVEVQPTAEPSKARRSSRKPEAKPTFKPTVAAA